jgi:hypothetical protein
MNVGFRERRSVVQDSSDVAAKMCSYSPIWFLHQTIVDFSPNLMFIAKVHKSMRKQMTRTWQKQFKKDNQSKISGAELREAHCSDRTTHTVGRVRQKLSGGVSSYSIAVSSGIIIWFSPRESTSHGSPRLSDGSTGSSSFLAIFISDIS